MSTEKSLPSLPILTVGHEAKSIRGLMMQRSDSELMFVDSARYTQNKPLAAQALGSTTEKRGRKTLFSIGSPDAA